MYKEGQMFLLKKEVKVGNNTFAKGSHAKIHNVVDYPENAWPYNIVFIERAVVHMAFDEDFIKENFEVLEKEGVE